MDCIFRTSHKGGIIMAKMLKKMLVLVDGERMASISVELGRYGLD
jgi:hypothetical protein